MRKKLVSLLLTTCLAIGLVSTTALAKDETLSKTVTTYRANLYGGCYQTTVNVKVTDIPEDGTLVINSEIENLKELTEGLKCNVVTYGMDSSLDYSATNVAHDKYGNASFDFIKNGTFVTRISLSVTGDHNVSNALSALAVADLLEIPAATAAKGLKEFTGTNRRFEYKGERNGFTIIDDYAHHPTEIAASLTSARHYPHREIWCIFQPHTYTRTKAL